MKIAVLSDIHGNMPALEAVTDHIERWQPDQVVVNGDIVNRGPRSDACLGFLMQKVEKGNWLLLRGNHEDFVARCADIKPPHSGPKYEVLKFAHWSYHQVEDQVSYLKNLPEQYEWQAPDGQLLRVTHASMINNRDGLYPMMSDNDFRERIAPAPAVFVTGHTHRALIRQIDDSLVVNTGAVGAPFDDDRRASYAQFTWDEQSGWHAEIVRIPYDYEQIERDYVESGFLDEAGPLAYLMLIELRKATGLVYLWIDRYQEAMLAGEISMEASVQALIDEVVDVKEKRPLL
ncbi:MAG: metallophosphoesterase [Chloroflexi bacterium]|nr:MAG: metallophosphoesterase [Chloroflexota bacterium]